MPIRPEIRHCYGPEFRRRRAALIEEKGKVCTFCGNEHALINAAHLEHDPLDNDSMELLCPSCHARHDWPHCLAIARRRKSRETGQLWLMPEIEYAPFPAWEIPGPVYDRLAQLQLFADA